MLQELQIGGTSSISMIIRKADFRWESKITDFDTIGLPRGYNIISLKNLNNFSDLTARGGAVSRAEQRI